MKSFKICLDLIPKKDKNIHKNTWNIKGLSDAKRLFSLYI